MDDIRDQLIIQLLQDELSIEEKTKLINWRKRHIDNEKHFQEIKFIWQKSQFSQTKSKEISIDVDAALANVHRQFSNSKTAKVVSLRRRFIRIAAASVILILTSLFWILNNPSIEMIKVVTATNEQKKITLPDESIVWLNENSQLTYPKTFGQNTREVNMNGNLVFEVTHNKQKPFIVKSENLSVQVLGTKFNVFSPNKINSSSFVHVLNGKVKVQRDDDSGNQVILQKGMSAMLNQKDSLFTTNDISSNRLFWLNKILTFDNTSLDKVFEDLKFAFDVEIEVENPKILSCVFSGNFDEKITIEELLEMMQFIFDIKIEKRSSTHFKIKEGKICN